MIYPQQRVGGAQRNSYIINVDKRERRNYYNYGRFRYIVRHCRNLEKED